MVVSSDGRTSISVNPATAHSTFHQHLVVVDGHCDVPLAVNRLTDAAGEVPALGETSIGRAIRAGGVDIVLSPVYAELEYLPDGSLRRALQGFVRTEQAAIRSGDEFVVVRSAHELEKTLGSGRTALILGLEGCTPLGYDPSLLEVFVRLGARILGLTWNERNAFASGSQQARDEGLSRLGKELVREADRLNLILDLSHLSERSFWDVLEDTSGPVVASHSNAHALYAHPRNITDDQIRAIGDRGGIVGLMIQQFALGSREATLKDFLHHVDHAVSLVGIERVGFGYDFISFVDGLEHMKPALERATAPPPKNLHKTIAEIETPADLPLLTSALLDHGYTEGEVAGLMGGNWARILMTELG